MKTTFLESSMKAATEKQDKTVNHEDVSPLWSSVLIQAIDDLNRPVHQQVAANWFISNLRYIGSFTWVCSALDISPKKIRDKFRSKIYNNFL